MVVVDDVDCNGPRGTALVLRVCGRNGVRNVTGVDRGVRAFVDKIAARLNGHLIEDVTRVGEERNGRWCHDVCQGRRPNGACLERYGDVGGRDNFGRQAEFVRQIFRLGNALKTDGNARHFPFVHVVAVLDAVAWLTTHVHCHASPVPGGPRRFVLALDPAHNEFWALA